MDILFRNEGAEKFISLFETDSQGRQVIREGIWINSEDNLPENASYLYDTENLFMPIISNDSVVEGATPEEVSTILRKRRKAMFIDVFEHVNNDLTAMPTSAVLNNLYPDVVVNFKVIASTIGMVLTKVNENQWKTDVINFI